MWGGGTSPVRWPAQKNTLNNKDYACTCVEEHLQFSPAGRSQHYSQAQSETVER